MFSLGKWTGKRTRPSTFETSLLNWLKTAAYSPIILSTCSVGALRSKINHWMGKKVAWNWKVRMANRYVDSLKNSQLQTKALKHPVFFLNDLIQHNSSFKMASMIRIGQSNVETVASTGTVLPPPERRKLYFNGLMHLLLTRSFALCGEQKRSVSWVWVRRGTTLQSTLTVGGITF